MLRVRDTGQGLNDKRGRRSPGAVPDPAAVRSGSENSPVNLSLTKALVEANRAPIPHQEPAAVPGTLIEIVFSQRGGGRRRAVIKLASATELPLPLPLAGEGWVGVPPRFTLFELREPPPAALFERSDLPRKPGEVN